MEDDVILGGKALLEKLLLLLIGQHLIRGVFKRYADRVGGQELTHVELCRLHNVLRMNGERGAEGEYGER